VVLVLIFAVSKWVGAVTVRMLFSFHSRGVRSRIVLEFSLPCLVARRNC